MVAGGERYKNRLRWKSNRHGNVMRFFLWVGIETEFYIKE